MAPERLILNLYDIGAINFGEFELKSGVISPIYLDLRLSVSHPRVLQGIARAIWELVYNVPHDLLCGVPYTALPIATCISIEHQRPMLIRRKEVKAYGKKKIIEGSFQKGQRCLVIEDLVTSGSSALETTAILEQEGLVVDDIAVLIDREQGGEQNLTQQGKRLHAAFSISEILDILHRNDKISLPTLESVLSFIKTHNLKVPAHAS